MEKEIIEGCKNSCKKSQREVFRIMSPQMLSVCLRYAKNKEEAEDLLIEGMLRVFKNIHNYQYKGSFEGWVKTIIRRTIIDAYRKKKIDYVELLEEHRDLSAPEIVDEIKGVPKNLLLRFIQDLPDRYRMVFNLYIFDELKHKEISELLNISIGTSKSNLNKARAKVIERCNLWINRDN